MFHAPPTRLHAGIGAAVTAMTLAGAVVVAPSGAAAATLPQITALSSYRGDTSCGSTVTLVGQNLDGAHRVVFGSIEADFQVLSPSRVRAHVPAHSKAKVAVRVVTDAGVSPVTPKAHYAWVHQPLNIHTTKLNCGMTAAQAIANSNTFRRRAARLKAVRTVRRVGHWTPAMGRNAVQRAGAWTGLSYSFAGGNAFGPTYGVRSDGGGWFDNRIWGFDCSGLALYAWAPYKGMGHFAAAQFRQAGRFHPRPSELMPGDLIFYSYNGKASGIDHVQLYTGGGQIIQAPESGYTIGTSTLSPAPRPFYAATRALTRHRLGAAPHVSRLSVTSGAASDPTTVIAYGTGLRYVSTVLVDGVRSYDFTPLSSHRLKITLPAHAAGPARIRIGGAWGVSNTVRFTYIGAPDLAAVSPGFGPEAAASAVTLAGDDFVSVTGVTVGGVAATNVTTLTSHTIQATLPAMPAGTYPVVVTTTYGSSAGSTQFTYVPAGGTGGTGGTGGAGGSAGSGGSAGTGGTGGGPSDPGPGGPGSYGGGS